jgi:ParB-like chromosome segregation protein Spo0J
MSLIKQPGVISSEQPGKPTRKGDMSMPLQFVAEDQQNITLSIKDLLSLKDVVKGAGAFAMREIDPGNLESLTCSDPGTWPPISVTKSSAGYIYYDGQHRIEAAKALKLETIQASCKTFTHINDLIEAAFRANLKHGLQASQETRSDYCYWLSITYPELTQRQIAIRVGVTQSTVSRAIEQRKKRLQEVKQQEIKQQQEKQEEEGDDGGLEAWKEGLIKRAKNFVKSAEKYSGTVQESDEYYDLVREIQLELLQGPEDRQVLQFTGQLLLDAASRTKLTRKAKVS